MNYIRREHAKYGKANNIIIKNDIKQIINNYGIDWQKLKNQTIMIENRSLFSDYILLKTINKVNYEEKLNLRIFKNHIINRVRKINYLICFWDDFSFKSFKNTLNFARKNNIQSLIFVLPSETIFENESIIQNCLNIAEKTAVNFVNIPPIISANENFCSNSIFAYLSRCVVLRKDISINNPEVMINACYISDVISALFFILINGGSGEVYNIKNLQISHKLGDIVDFLTHKYYFINSKISANDILIAQYQNSNTKNIESLGWNAQIDMEEAFSKVISSFIYQKKSVEKKHSIKNQLKHSIFNTCTNWIAKKYKIHINLESIFSLKNEYNQKFKLKIVTILGVKIKFKLNKKIKNCVAIVDCGGIGDYMFCRPYFKYIKESPRFKDCYFIYLCKNAYKDMLETFDSSFFDKVITYNSDYKALKKKIKLYDIHVLIDLFSLTECNSFRGWIVRNNLVKALKIKKSIADVIIEKQEDLNNENLKIFNEFITTEPKYFELERRRQFFEKLTQIPIPKIDKKIEPLIDFNKEYICFSLFTNDKKRNYEDSKWIEVINYITKNTSVDTQLVFLGGERDKVGISRILNHLEDNSKCINLAGKTNITLIPSILKGAKFLISLETGTVHIAESVGGVPALCITCGSYWGRFLPYPNNQVKYVFPDEFEKILEKNNLEVLSKFYEANWSFKVNEISPKKIIQVIEKYFLKYLQDKRCIENEHSVSKAVGGGGNLFL